MIVLIKLLFTRESQSFIHYWMGGVGLNLQEKLAQPCQWRVGAAYSSPAQNSFWILEDMAVHACGPLVSVESVGLALGQTLTAMPFLCKYVNWLFLLLYKCVLCVLC